MTEQRNSPPPQRITIVGALSLTLAAGACGGDETDFGQCQEESGCYYYTDEGYLDEGPYTDEGYHDEGYHDEGYHDEGYYDEGWPPDEGYYTEEGPWPTTDPTTSDPSDSWTTTSTTSTSTTDDTASSSSTTTDTSTTGSTTDTTTGSTTDTTSSTGSTTDTGSTGSTTDTGGQEVNFPPAGVFGDDVQELDLVGTWSLQWAPDGTTWDSVLTIDDIGDFVWRETSADCSSDKQATGHLWVEPGQIVMHIETWERQLPWDTLAIAGQEFPPPFRLRMTYALLGPNLALAGTDRLVEAEPYAGRAYLQTATAGKFIAGEYYSEAELLAAFDGELDAKVIVRDRFLPTLDVEPADIPESTGIVVHDQVYWGLDPPVGTPTIFEGGNWTCLNGCPLPAGATLINGGNLYAYGPYAAFQRMMTFASGRSFKRDVDTDCP